MTPDPEPISNGEFAWIAVGVAVVIAMAAWLNHFWSTT